MKRSILICCGTGCRASDSVGVAEALQEACSQASNGIAVEVEVKKTGCNGFCENGPIVTILPDNISYYKVKSKDAPSIVAALDAEPIERLLYRDLDGRRVKNQQENSFYSKQHKIALRNIGIIDPECIEDYEERGGYLALRKALALTADQIIAEVEASGLRGRGGAGFPTGRKWATAASYDVFPKYVVCNGDEGDPGAFMDRSILEGDPHSVLEGMALCALAIGAKEGYLYIRDEYGLANSAVQKALADAQEKGYLGSSIMGSKHALHLSIVRGGGAFVCGESTALMTSIEGYVGEPRAKYIRSVERGLWGKPTVLNNVETFANIPVILAGGGESFAGFGTEKSKGTKVFTLVGKVKRTGLVEVPMGVTLRHIIFDIGGGVMGDRTFKAVQTGGPSGGCLPEDLLDLTVDFDSLEKAGSMMGSGGMIVMDDHSCMVEVARYYVEFLSEESCGKCTPCREGLRQMRKILTDICEGRGEPGDIELLESIARVMKDASLCALGKSAANPVLSTIRSFRDEYLAHIEDHLCSAGVCKDLTTFVIDAARCTGCMRCVKACPTNAINGAKKEVHVIDQELCISCGSCREACSFNAVIATGKHPGAAQDLVRTERQS